MRIARSVAAAFALLIAGLVRGESPPQSMLDVFSARHFGENWQIYAADWLRYENWRHFDPAGEIGSPDYGYLFNRFRFGARATGSGWSLDAAAQVVNQVSLPDNATGVPGGPLGLGAVYFNHNRSRNPATIFLKSLNAGLRNLFGTGVDVVAGRMDYGSGMESPSGVPRIDQLKDMRIDSRLLGNFDWSAYQRSFDGLKAKRRIGPGTFDFAAFHPTQGGFEHDANVSIDEIDVFTFAYTVPPQALLPHTEVQAFLYLFEDDRQIAVRPDNSGLGATRQDIDLYNLGGHLVGAYPVGPGTADFLAWGVWQGGDWFEQDHDAYGVAVEGGYQWTKLPGKPWLRTGYYRGSGDDAPGDDKHATFYQMLPTVRKYSFTTTYNLMNNTDWFVQVLVQPVERLRVRADYHILGLTESQDLWWQGAGATQSHGTIQGFSGRPSGGGRSLAHSFEITAVYQITAFASLQLFYGRMEGKEVVEHHFAEDDDFDLFFSELNVRF